MSKWKLIERFLLISHLMAAAAKGMADTSVQFPTDAPFTKSVPPGR